ncbi:MAG TPA: hypothetical protein VK717_01605 [Opitutaceae bacterium]|jgi:hypothetical protein|nr:hypothetical protein [Opitutaceae bacterium]
MKSPASVSPAHEINRLHEEVARQTDNSRKCLHAALMAAWQAGQLLLAEQKRVRRTMGGAWGHWLEEKFCGSRRTAQNYMRLAETVPDVSAFQGLSLRQVYLRLGIATEPKSRAESARVEKLPPHIRLASKLLVALKTRNDAPTSTPEQWVLLQQDLRALYDQLRCIFEAGPAATTPLNSVRPVVSTK